MPRCVSLRVLLPFLLCALFAPAALAANLIVNPTFDIEVPSNDTGGGWTSENIDGLGGWLAVGPTPPSFRLNTSGGTASRIEQEVTGLVIGTTYFLHGDYALGFGGGNPDDTFLIDVDGVVIASLGPAPLHDPDPSSFPFDSFDASFVATAETQTLRFTGQANGSDHDYFIDNICLDTVACTVPEPSSAALLGIGLSLTSLLARRFAA